MKRGPGKATQVDELVPVVDYGFPKGFVFGAATSAYQIEGAANQDGKGPSFWDVFAHAPGNMAKGAHGDVACDHYNRSREDVALMKSLGLGAYRFSLSWSRVMPDGRGRVNAQGLDFYDRLVDDLLASGIEPFPTLYHWDLPLSLHEIGGWLNRDLSFHFADYAAAVVGRLKDRVRHWTTMNELEVIVAGYTGKGLAPGFDAPRLHAQTGHNLLLAHGRAMGAIRAAAPRVQAGIVLNFVPIEPSDGSQEARAAAERRWSTSYGWYLDGILRGRYPDAILDAERLGLLAVAAADMGTIAAPIDFLGVNYYTRFRADRTGALVPPGPGVPVTLMGWEIEPASMTAMLLRFQSEYDKMPPIFITENGAALRDMAESGRVVDLERARYLHAHLLALRDAIAGGADVRGYFVWSLLDNLEWSLGYDMTFGLVSVDRGSLRRTPKFSAEWYRDVIRRNSQVGALSGVA